MWGKKNHNWRAQVGQHHNKQNKGRENLPEVSVGGSSGLLAFARKPSHQFIFLLLALSAAGVVNAESAGAKAERKSTSKKSDAKQVANSAVPTVDVPASQPVHGVNNKNTAAGLSAHASRQSQATTVELKSDQRMIKSDIDAAYKTNNYKKAVKLCTEYLKLQPQSLDIHGTRGLSYFKQGKWRKALNDFKAYGSRPHNNHEVFHASAISHYNLQQYDGVIKNYESYFAHPQIKVKENIAKMDVATESDRLTLSDDYGRVAKAYQELGKDYKKAVANWDKAIKYNKNKAISYPERAACLVHLGTPEGYQRALNDIATAFKLDPAYQIISSDSKKNRKHAEAYATRGYCDIQLKKFLDAVVAYDTAIIRDLNNAKYHYYRSSAHHSMGSFAQAVKDGETAYRLDPIPEYLKQLEEIKKQQEIININMNEFIMLGDRALNSKTYTAAEKFYTSAIRINPAYISKTIYCKRAVCYSGMGEHQKALDDCQIGIPLGTGINNDNWNCFEASANSLDALGRHEEAIRDFTALINHAPDKEMLYKFRAKIYMKQQRHEDVIKDYDSYFALQLKKPIKNGQVHVLGIDYNHRANAYCELGKYELAKKDWDEAIRLEPGNGQYCYNRAQASVYLRNFQEAIKDYDAAIRLEPNNDLYYYMRAVANTHVGHYTQTHIDASKAYELNPKPEYLDVMQKAKRKISNFNEKDDTTWVGYAAKYIFYATAGYAAYFFGYKRPKEARQRQQAAEKAVKKQQAEARIEQERQAEAKIAQDKKEAVAAKIAEEKYLLTQTDQLKACFKDFDGAYLITFAVIKEQANKYKFTITAQEGSRLTLKENKACFLNGETLITDLSVSLQHLKPILTEKSNEKELELSISYEQPEAFCLAVKAAVDGVVSKLKEHYATGQNALLADEKNKSRREHANLRAKVTDVRAVFDPLFSTATALRDEISIILVDLKDQKPSTNQRKRTQEVLDSFDRFANGKSKEQLDKKFPPMPDYKSDVNDNDGFDYAAAEDSISWVTEMSKFLKQLDSAQTILVPFLSMLQVEKEAKAEEEKAVQAAELAAENIKKEAEKNAAAAKEAAEKLAAAKKAAEAATSERILAGEVERDKKIGEAKAKYDAKAKQAAEDAKIVEALSTPKPLKDILYPHNLGNLTSNECVTLVLNSAANISALVGYDEKPQEKNAVLLFRWKKYFALQCELLHYVSAMAEFMSRLPGDNSQSAILLNKLRNAIKHVPDSKSQDELFAFAQQLSDVVAPILSLQPIANDSSSLKLDQQKAIKLAQTLGFMQNPADQKDSKADLSENIFYKKMVAQLDKMRTSAEFVMDDGSYCAWVRNQIIPIINTHAENFIKNTSVSAAAALNSVDGLVLKLLFTRAVEPYTEPRQQTLKKGSNKYATEELMGFIWQCRTKIYGKHGHEDPRAMDEQAIRYVLKLAEKINSKKCDPNKVDLAFPVKQTLPATAAAAAKDSKSTANDKKRNDNSARGDSGVRNRYRQGAPPAASTATAAAVQQTPIAAASMSHKVDVSRFNM